MPSVGSRPVTSGSQTSMSRPLSIDASDSLKPTIEARFKQERNRREILQNAKRDMDAPVLRGTCETMCPPFEVLERTFRNEVEGFERSENAEDYAKYVKAYKRSAAGDGAVLAEDLRTLDALSLTWNHLLGIVEQRGIAASHNFVWNRSRALRKDLMTQSMHSLSALRLYEESVRYHFYTLQQLSGASNYERFQEVEQLNNALVSVHDCYKELGSAYSRLLWHYQTRPRREAIALCRIYRKHRLVQLALKTLRIVKSIEEVASTDADFNITPIQEYFQLLLDEKTPYMLAVAASFFVDRIRYWTLRSFARAGFQSSKGLVPTVSLLHHLTDLLHFCDIEECRDFTTVAGLTITKDGGVLFGKRNENGTTQLQDIVFGVEGDSWKTPERTKKSLRYLDGKIVDSSIRHLIAASNDGMMDLSDSSSSSTLKSDNLLSISIQRTSTPILYTHKSTTPRQIPNGFGAVAHTVSSIPFKTTYFSHSQESGSQVEDLPGSPMDISSVHLLDDPHTSHYSSFQVPVQSLRSNMMSQQQNLPQPNGRSLPSMVGLKRRLTIDSLDDIQHTPSASNLTITVPNWMGTKNQLVANGQEMPVSHLSLASNHQNAYSDTLHNFNFSSDPDTLVTAYSQNGLAFADSSLLSTMPTYTTTDPMLLISPKRKKSAVFELHGGQLYNSTVLEQGSSLRHSVKPDSNLILQDLLSQFLPDAVLLIVQDAAQRATNKLELCRRQAKHTMRRSFRLWRTSMLSHAFTVSGELHLFTPATTHGHIRYDNLLCQCYQFVIKGVPQKLTWWSCKFINAANGYNMTEAHAGIVACWNNTICLLRSMLDTYTECTVCTNGIDLTQCTMLLSLPSWESFDAHTRPGHIAKCLRQRLNHLINNLPLTSEQHQYLRLLMMSAKEYVQEEAERSLFNNIMSVLLLFMWKHLDALFVSQSRIVVISIKRFEHLRNSLREMNAHFHSEMARFSHHLLSSMEKQVLRTEEVLRKQAYQPTPANKVLQDVPLSEAAYLSLINKHGLYVFSLYYDFHDYMPLLIIRLGHQSLSQMVV